MDAKDELMEHDYQQEMERLSQAQRDWRSLWPNHCEHCGGWGGFETYESHPYGSTTATEILWDDCEHCVVNGICPRCGSECLQPDADGDFFLGPCTHCGWNFDDGIPHL